MWKSGRWPLTDGASPPLLVDHFFRREYGRLVAGLLRRVGVQHVERVEDAVQSALMTALTSWVDHGVPLDPEGWLYRVAHNQLLDSLRRTTGRQAILEQAAAELGPEQTESSPPRFRGEVQDDLLRMIFVCCDEAIPTESRLVLALKTLCGFSTAEISLRLFITEANVHKRLARARERLREGPADFQTLAPETLQTRLASVQTVLYLLFNEGYLSAQPDQAVRRELCDEAIRLTTVLAEHRGGATPATFALLALMHFHAARLDTRLDPMGGLVLLEEQDRSSWDQQQLILGAQWLQKAATGETFTRFHAEAGIAAEHTFAPSFAQTRWSKLADLYALLEQVAPSPLNALNRAVVIAHWQGAEAGLAVLQAVDPPPWLLGYHLWDAVSGELHRRAGHREEARRCLERALAAAPTDAERDLLDRRLASLLASDR